MNVIHDAEKKEFRVELGAYRAALMYAKRGDMLDFYHIYVPEPFRGQRVAGTLDNIFITEKERPWPMKQSL